MGRAAGSVRLVFLATFAAMLGSGRSFAGDTSSGNRAKAEVATATAIEFYDPALDHYFVSPLAPDIEALDTGRFAGWYRTGQAFKVFTDPAATTLAVSPVCRYYIPPQHGDSHFLSASPAECAAVARRVATDPAYSGYVLESAAAFRVALPDPASGACPAPTVPLYRLWNGRVDSNHRYTTSAATKAELVARGYVAEGYGSDAVSMCVPAAPPPDIVLASGPTPLAPGCDATPASGVLYVNAEVEPVVEVDPLDAAHLIGVWQQDRWSDGGARGLLTGVSRDGGRTWTRTAAAFTRCTGGASVGGDYPRATDPWITFSPDGIAWQIAIAFGGPSFGPSAQNAVLVSRSSDGGVSWSAPTPLRRDARTAFNDKESITADPFDGRYVYAVWDRLLETGSGPTWLARTVDGGASWESARAIYDPGPHSQTLNNQIVVLPDGTLLDFFTRFDLDADNQLLATLAIIRSTDRGASWSVPIDIARSLAIGVGDPATGAPVRDAANVGSIAVGRDGRIAVVWQDSRFSAGLRDAIAYAQSSDGGLTWSSPVRVNAAPDVQAFVPTVRIRDDGVIGVTYYDLRNDTSSATLPTDYWLAYSTDGVAWRETHVAGPFDLAGAPFAGGLFLGDYQGLASAGAVFLPLFARATGSASDPTDIVLGFTDAGGVTAGKSRGGATTASAKAEPGAEPALTPAWRARTAAAARATLERRLRGPRDAQD